MYDHAMVICLEQHDSGWPSFPPPLHSSLRSVSDCWADCALQAEEGHTELDSPVYTINPVSRTAVVEPRRLRAGVDFQKAGPFRGQPHEHPFRDSRAERLPQQLPWEAEASSTSVSSGFGVSEAGAARLTPEARAALQLKHGVDVSVDRMQLGGSRGSLVVSEGSDVAALEHSGHLLWLFMQSQEQPVSHGQEHRHRCVHVTR